MPFPSSHQSISTTIGNQSDTHQNSQILYQKFKSDVIAGFHQDTPFVLKSEDIDKWLQNNGVVFIDHRDLRVIHENYVDKTYGLMRLDITDTFAYELDEIVDLIRTDATSAQSKLLGIVNELRGESP